MPDYKLRRELPRTTAAGFHYDGVLVLPLAQVPAPKVIAPVSETTATKSTDNVVIPFPVASSTGTVAKPQSVEQHSSNPIFNLFHSRNAQRVAVVAAAAGLVFAAANPGQGVAEESSPQAADVPTETTAPRAQAQVAKKIIVPKDAGASIERVAYTTSANKDDKLSEIMAASSSGETEIDGVEGMLAHPVSNVRITSRFGMRPDPWTGYGMVDHIGQDYGIACGTDVFAAASGVVTQAEWAGHSGNRVSVDHGNGLVTTYNHNTSLSVEVGDTVDRGDLVALAGTTGNSTGCHLHFEVLVDGTAVDPADWLPAE